MKIRELLEAVGTVSGSPIVQGIKLGLNMSPNASFASGAATNFLRKANMRHTAAATVADPRWDGMNAPDGKYYDRATLEKFKTGTDFDHPIYGRVKVKNAAKNAITLDTAKQLGHDISLRPSEMAQLYTTTPGQPRPPEPKPAQTGSQTLPDSPQPGSTVQSSGSHQPGASEQPSATDLHKQLQAQKYMNMRAR